MVLYIKIKNLLDEYEQLKSLGATWKNDNRELSTPSPELITRAKYWVITINECYSNLRLQYRYIDLESEKESTFYELLNICNGLFPNIVNRIISFNEKSLNQENVLSKLGLSYHFLI